MDSKPYAKALLDPDPPSATPYVVPAGARRQITSAIVRDMFRDWRQIPADLDALFSGAKGGGARFLPEAFLEMRVAGKIFAQQFDGHGTFQHQVTRSVDDSHAAAAQDFPELVLAPE